MSIDSNVCEIGKNRIEALSDGIFAIVMTLLILEIHVPDLPSNAANVQVAPALWHLKHRSARTGRIDFSKSSTPSRSGGAS